MTLLSACPGTYFNCIMFMVASSVVTTIMILNYHHRKADTHNMPAWVRIIFLQWIPWFLRMSRPGEKITLKTLTIQSKMKELDPPSKSLLANVLDMEDDYRPTVPPPPLPPSNHHNHLSPPLSNHINNHNHAHKNGGLFRYFLSFYHLIAFDKDERLNLFFMKANELGPKVDVSSAQRLIIPGTNPKPLGAFSKSRQKFSWLFQISFFGKFLVFFLQIGYLGQFL